MGSKPVAALRPGVGSCVAGFHRRTALARSTCTSWAARPTEEYQLGVTQSIRVASIPFSDPYVDAVLPDDVVRVGPSGEPSAWLEQWHLAAHADDVDVVHLHTEYEHLAVADLEDWAETLRRLGVPLV